MTDNQINDTISFINNSISIINEERSKLPFSLNLIDELHANENAHTRILMKLLHYQFNRKFTILESFLHLSNTLLDENESVQISENMDSPILNIGKEYIDGLVEGNGQAVIIENKIHNAVDQDKQIANYFKIVRDEHHIPPQNIYVIYLTLNGEKEVQDYSLTDETKQSLNYSLEHPGRFIKMNYRDHIIPWLSDCVLPNCDSKEELLISAITQYIDHLKGITNTRNREIKMNEEIQRRIVSLLGIDRLSSNEEYKIIKSKADELETTAKSLKDYLYNMTYGKLLTISEKIIDSKTSSKSIVKHGDDFAYIRLPHWHDTIHFEFYPLCIKDFFKQDFTLCFGFHLEGCDEKFKDQARTATIDVLRKIDGVNYNGDVNHEYALFEKTYYTPVSLCDMDNEQMESFLDGIFSEFFEFLQTFDVFFKNIA